MPHYLYLQIIFFLSELSLLIFKRSNSAGKNNKDRRSLIILWLVIALCFTIAPFSAIWGILPIGNYTIITYEGMAVTFIGFAIRWTAIIQLGRMFTVDVAITNDHNLKTTGLYKIVRHPSYLGLMLIIAGFAICLNNVAGFLIITIPTFWAINYRIIVEEQALVAEFGEQYINYKKQVKKIIPWVF